MKKIISVELQKILTYPIFWVFIGFLLGLFLLSTLLTTKLEINFFGSAVDIQNYFRFPYIWNTFTWIANWYNHILSVLIIILVCNEFNYRTFKQALIDGTTRNQLITGKLLIIIMLSLAYTLVIFIITIIFGLINTSNFTFNILIEQIYFIGIRIFQSFAIMSLAMMIAFVIKNTALSFIIYFGYFFFELILRGFLSFKDYQFRFYFPMKVISNLTPRPSISTAITQQDYSQYTDSIENITSQPNYLLTIVFVAIYTSIFLAVSYFVTNKRNY